MRLLAAVKGYRLGKVDSASLFSGGNYFKKRVVALSMRDLIH